VAAVRRALLLLVVTVLICAGCAGGSAEEGSASTVPAPPSLAEQGLSATESCLLYRGKKRWCLSGTYGDEWWIGQYEGDRSGRYYATNHKDEVLGYLRPTSYGWRAMVSVCGLAGPHNCGWARGGRVVRTGRRNVLFVYSAGNPRGAQGCVFTRCDGKPRREVARGPHAIEVALHKFVWGD
jgi:hypothetical protein